MDTRENTICDRPEMRGVRCDLPVSYAAMEQEAIAAIERLLTAKPKARRLWGLLAADDEVGASWSMANYIAVRKLGMNDHGKTHATIATASALRMLELLVAAGIEPDVVASGAGDEDDAALAVLSATLCHDFGSMVHRDEHSAISVSLAVPVLDRLLPEIYPDAAKRTAIRSFILSAIFTHHGEPRPLTIEAALVCIGDATDMTKGRGRLAFDAGSVTIHTVSALSIERVTIRKGEERPIEIRVFMSNSAGIFQVQEILGRKVALGPLAGYVEVTAVMEPDLGDYEQRIVYGIRMTGTTFSPITDARQ
jgi:metal-dependent HD superfamily phosphatase/phosphodiesterase